MTNETTLNKLIEMRFTAMADAFRMQLNDSSLNNFSFEERMGLPLTSSTIAGRIIA